MLLDCIYESFSTLFNVKVKTYCGEEEEEEGTRRLTR
jgi:hypothetical protein